MSTLKKISTLVALVLLGTFSSVFAATYYSIAAGSYTNGAIWSLDGTNPCGCTPPLTLSSDDVVIRHAVTMNGDITVDGGTLTIDATGSFTGSDNLYITSGFVDNDGSISVDLMEISPAGIYTADGSTSVNNSDFLIEGTATFNGALLVQNGNLELKPGGRAEFGAGVSVTILNGNVSNEGDITFNPGACVDAGNGNFDNKTGSNVFGAGGIRVSGNVVNDGSWSASVDWCAGGSGGGANPLPAENCGGVCGVLPVTLTSFTGNRTSSAVLLEWVVEGEENNSFFTLERSVNGADFETVDFVPSAGSEGGSEYAYTDIGASEGELVYKLKQTDLNGQTTELGVISVASSNAGLSVKAFPNPFAESISVQVTGGEVNDLELYVYDIKGQLVRSYQYDQLAGTIQLTDLDNLEPGMYILKGASSNSVISPARIVKQ